MIDIPFCVKFHFEGHSILSDITFWVTFHFEWHSILSDIPFCVTFHFEGHSILSGILFWVTFHFEWHSILSDIPFWVTFPSECHSILSDWLVSQSQWWNLRWYRTVNFQSVCEWVRLIIRTRDASAFKNTAQIQGWWWAMDALHPPPVFRAPRVGDGRSAPTPRF